MLDWMARKIWEVVTWIPAVFLEEGSPNYALVRTMFALLFITLIVYLIALCSPPSTFTRYIQAITHLFTRRR
jgi:hypothetical protein